VFDNKIGKSEFLSCVLRHDIMPFFIMLFPMKKIIILIITAVLALAGCREYIDIEIPEEEKVMVLNGFINSDNPVRLNLSKSMGVLEARNAFEFIETAEVELYEDGEFAELLVFDTLGFYSGTLIPSEGKRYELRASHADMKAISSSAFIPQKVPIKSVESTFVADSVTEQWWNPQTQEYFDTTIVRLSEEGVIEIRFDDPGNAENYYFVTFNCLMPLYDWRDGQQIRIGEEMLSLDYDHNTLPYENYLYMDNFKGFVFSDEFFNGSEYLFTAHVYNFGMYYYEGGGMTLSPIYVNLHSVSKDFFLFVTSYSKYDEAAYNPFAEPVNVFSNVENGFGFFTGYATVTDSVNFR
jgi:hypothetical protein